MYKKESIVVSTRENTERKGENNMKRLISTLLLLASIVAMVVNVSPVYGKAVNKATRVHEYSKVCKVDFDKSGLTLKQTKKMVKFANRLELVPEVPFDFGDYIVILTKSSERNTVWETLETRTKPVVTIEYGMILDREGNGCTEDGHYYINYGNIVSTGCKPGTWVKTICVYGANDQYTDSIAYRYDVEVRNKLF